MKAMMANLRKYEPTYQLTKVVTVKGLEDIRGVEDEEQKKPSACAACHKEPEVAIPAVCSYCNEPVCPPCRTKEIDGKCLVCGGVYTGVPVDATIAALVGA